LFKVLGSRFFEVGFGFLGFGCFEVEFGLLGFGRFEVALDARRIGGVARLCRSAVFAGVGGILGRGGSDQ
jgi:hypothetical protein